MEGNTHVIDMVGKAAAIYHIKDTDALLDAVLDDYDFDTEELKKVTIQDIIEISDASGIE